MNKKMLEMIVKFGGELHKHEENHYKLEKAMVECGKLLEEHEAHQKLMDDMKVEMLVELKKEMPDKAEEMAEKFGIDLENKTINLDKKEKIGFA